MLGQMCCMNSRFLHSPLGLPTAPKLCVSRNLPRAEGAGPRPTNPALKQLYDFRYIVFDNVGLSVAISEPQDGERRQRFFNRHKEVSLRGVKDKQ